MRKLAGFRLRAGLRQFGQRVRFHGRGGNDVFAGRHSAAALQAGNRAERIQLSGYRIQVRAFTGKLLVLVHVPMTDIVRLQITEALSFLHNNNLFIHRNVCPGSILVTKRGTWKLCGMEFIGERFDNLVLPSHINISNSAERLN